MTDHGQWYKPAEFSWFNPISYIYTWPAPPSESDRLFTQVKNELIEFARHPDKHVEKNLIKSIKYSLVLKIIGFILTHVFPFVGYGIIFFSIYYIDIAIYNSPGKLEKIVAKVSAKVDESIFYIFTPRSEITEE